MREKNKKNQVIKIRIYEDEKDRIKAAAKQKNVSLSEYVRQCLQSPPQITAHDYYNISENLTKEINKIGVNINQIAHQYNAFEITKASEELTKQMGEISLILAEINKKLEGIYADS